MGSVCKPSRMGNVEPYIYTAQDCSVKIYTKLITLHHIYIILYIRLYYCIGDSSIELHWVQIMVYQVEWQDMPVVIFLCV